MPLYLQTLSCDACFPVQALLARGSAHAPDLLVESAADGESVPCTCLLDRTCQEARLLCCSLGHQAAVLRVFVVFTRFVELLLLRVQDGMLFRGVAKVLSHDEVVGGAHHACFLERVRS